jgi:hypothetical protein
MAAVVDAIADYADEHASALQEAAGLAKGLRRKLHKWGVWRHAAAIGAAAAGAGPEETAAAAAAVEVAGGAGMEDDEPVRAFETVAHFHDEFEELIACLGVDLQAVVVFIDDMDRCSNAETIVETFEAMRLFLHAPTTAYVVGAHEDIVEAALDRRYEGRLAGDEDLGSHWLEKMLQHPIKVPPLGGPEVMSYINLLFAEIHTSSEHFGELRAKADDNRRTNPFQVAMNAGIARDTIGELSAELSEALDIAAEVAPLLAQNLRGNPRETKLIPEPLPPAHGDGTPALVAARGSQASEADGARRAARPEPLRARFHLAPGLGYRSLAGARGGRTARQRGEG